MKIISPVSFFLPPDIWIIIFQILLVTMNICLVRFHRALETVCKCLLIIATLRLQETINKWCNQNYKLGFLTSSHKFQPQNLILLFKVLLQETRLTPKAKLWGLSKLEGMTFFFLFWAVALTSVIFFWLHKIGFYDQENKILAKKQDILWWSDILETSMCK